MVAGARILVVEDDAAINRVVCSYLGKAGAACTAAFSGTEGLMALEGGAFDLLVTDLMLPGAPGEEVVAVARAQGVPVVVLSARAAVADRVDLLRIGADDYLVKPFDLEELLARCEAVLRRSAPAAFAGDGLRRGDRPVAHGPDVVDASRQPSAAPNPGRPGGRPYEGGPAGHSEEGLGSSEGRSTDDAPLRFRSWELDEAAHAFTVNGTPIALTPTEFALVRTLMAAPARVHTKRALSEAAGGDAAALGDKTVATHIGNIRAKLRVTGTDDYLETVWGVGFKLRD